MRLIRIAAVAVLVLCAASAFAQKSADEQAVWKLEHAYWEDVKALDLASYRALWHPNFLGWPYVSSEPQRKDHITDWITLSNKGLRMKSYTLEPAASQATGDLVVTHYWLTSVWTGKNGDRPPTTMRVTHTWLRVGDGWQIISGMSALVSNPRH